MSFLVSGNLLYGNTYEKQIEQRRTLPRFSSSSKCDQTLVILYAIGDYAKDGGPGEV